jgi:rare lipoprotein A (peptidoglycan hydrolase)
MPAKEDRLGEHAMKRPRSTSLYLHRVNAPIKEPANGTKANGDIMKVLNSLITASLLTLLPISIVDAKITDPSWFASSKDDKKKHHRHTKISHHPKHNKKVYSKNVGKASWYGPGFHGRRTASGERFNQFGLTAAHKTLPLGTRVRVTNLATDESVVVRINDRGPYARGRIIDLSRGAAAAIGLKGVGNVMIARID